MFSEVVAVAFERWSFTRGFTYSNEIRNFAVLDKWSRITRACRLGRFDCIQNLFFYSLSSPFLNLKSGAVTLDVFPKASLGEIVHMFCHQNGDPLSSNQAFPHPFDYIWASKHSRHPCYVVRSKKRKEKHGITWGVADRSRGRKSLSKN